MKKNTKFAIFVILLLFVLAYFGANYYNLNKYKIDFECASTYHVGEVANINVDIYKR